METNRLQKLIQRYINGECTPDEITAVHEWYDSFEREQNPMDLLSTEQQLQLKKRLISRIRTNITSLDKTEGTPVDKRFLSPALIYSLSGIAATVLLVMGIIFFKYDFSHPPATTNMVVVNMTKSIQKVALEDGSIVWLNPGSRIKYPKKFKGAQRNVQMEGEAFFEVTHDKSRPFTIYSDNLVTRVWGTSFRIRAYENNPAEVSVVTGKVSVRLQQQEGSEIMLLPNQKVTYLKKANVLKKETEQKTSVMRIWKKATLSFDNEPIKEVIKALNITFGVHISSPDEKLLNYALKADFTDQSLPSILEMLEKSLDLQYEINDKEIILKKLTINN
jgi:transmembrane sensor